MDATSVVNKRHPSNTIHVACTAMDERYNLHLTRHHRYVWRCDNELFVHADRGSYFGCKACSLGIRSRDPQVSQGKDCMPPTGLTYVKLKSWTPRHSPALISQPQCLQYVKQPAHLPRELSRHVSLAAVWQVQHGPAVAAVHECMQRHTRQQRLHQALIQLVINNLTSLLVVGWQDCLIRPV